ncbi:MAG TPA: SDR family oxidoreductase [Acetobacteraceae bacterium]|jgi:3-oxoacyl-[acyl-carrier protein] reductase|nr:SDR family oxidoreductase [Acetobacteraceae bacterium]
MEVCLDGRTAIITGASKGLGLAMAKEFAASGADVAILARRPEVLEEAKAIVAATATGRVATFSCDVGKADDITRTYAAVMGTFGKVDIMVNNAGISRAMPFEQITDEMWHEDLELKLFQAIRFCRLVMPQMKERRWGRIINVLNIGAKAPRPNGAPTAVSRAAGMALTKILAGEGAPHNVLVNAMLVGQIVSDQWVRRHAAQGANEPFDDFVAKLGASVPLGRLGKAEEFAAMACLLVSDLGGFTTGTAINMDGGASPVV